MQYRTLGKTGLKVSVLGFGCGAVGGLMVAGDEKTMQRTVERAIEAGINYFDTAQAYGNGASETNLGRVLKQLKPQVIVGSKVQLRDGDFEHIEDAIVQSVESSLRRLQLDRLDLFQLHNPIGLTRQTERGWVGLADLDAAARAFRKLQSQGRIRHWGINGLGDTDALLAATQTSGADTMQICCNLLNPSAALVAPQDFAFQDYKQLMQRATHAQMGVMAIRVMAGGALAGTNARHPVATQTVAPIASSATFEADVALSKRFNHLVRPEWANSLAEAAIRFVISQPNVSSALLGISSPEQLEEGIAAAERGPLLSEALAQVPFISKASAIV
jgi:aryl-alcohol dehydrogenase-like predicted oxidoreductase